MRIKKLIAFVMSLILSIPIITSVFSYTTFAASGPDLVFTYATITSRTRTGVYYKFTIKNQGDTTIPSLYNVSIQNYYSANTIYGESVDTPANGKILGVNSPLAPGKSYTGTFYSLEKQPVGKNHLTFKIDSNNAIAETNERNNTSWFYIAPKVDLVFTNIKITSKTQNRIDYTYTIKNIGTKSITSLDNTVCIQNYLCSSKKTMEGISYAAGGGFITSKTSLAPGESYTGNYPAFGDTSKPYLKVYIDWGNSTMEYNSVIISTQ